MNDKRDKVSVGELLQNLWTEETTTYPDGVPFVEALQHGSMSVELFAPRGDDLQEPHDQDELYIVIEGNSSFLRAEETLSVSAGDVLFVPAGLPHRFFDIGPSFMTWAVFWGPTGGEHADQ